MIAFNLPGIPELIIIGALIVLLFGARKATDWAKAAGESLREFRKVKRDLENDPDLK